MSKILSFNNKLLANPSGSKLLGDSSVSGLPFTRITYDGLRKSDLFPEQQGSFIAYKYVVPVENTTLKKWTIGFATDQGTAPHYGGADIRFCSIIDGDILDVTWDDHHSLTDFMLTPPDIVTYDQVSLVDSSGYTGYLMDCQMVNLSDSPTLLANHLYLIPVLLNNGFSTLWNLKPITYNSPNPSIPARVIFSFTNLDLRAYDWKNNSTTFETTSIPYLKVADLAGTYDMEI